MRIAQMRAIDIANGPGIRATLFVSGCTHNCKGCFNQEYRNFSYGEEFDSKKGFEFLEMVKNPNVKGVTILGGEPFDQDEELLILVNHIAHATGKPIWIFSGYTFEQLLKKPLAVKILNKCEVLVDGPFIEELKDIRLRFRGSSNQRILDVQKSLAMKKAIPHIKYYMGTNN